MRKLIFTLCLMIPAITFAEEIEVISEVPNYVTIYHRQCDLQQVYVDQPSSGGINLFGTAIGALLGNQIGGGSGRDIATVVGGVVGNNVSNRRSYRQPRLEYRNICNDVPTVIQRGTLLTYKYKGKVYTRVVD
jgi:outer membrane lipoprotein SlyB